MRPLRLPALKLAQGSAEAASEHALLLLPRLRLIRKQRVDTATRIEILLNELSEVGSDTRDHGPERPTDVDVLRSLPGVGRIVAVILFDSVIEILARTDTHSFGDRPRSLQLPNGTMRGRICIQRDDARRSVSLHRLLKETFGCSDVPLRREQEIHRSPLLVDSAIEVCPPALHFYIRLVAAP